MQLIVDQMEVLIHLFFYSLDFNFLCVLFVCVL